MEEQMLIKEIQIVGIAATANRLQQQNGLSYQDALYKILTTAQEQGNLAIAALASKLYEFSVN